MYDINKILEEISAEHKDLVEKYCESSEKFNLSELTQYIIPKVVKFGVELEFRTLTLISDLLILKLINYKNEKNKKSN
jgi:hypothetical protein